MLPENVISCADTDLGETWFSKTAKKGGIDPTQICRSLGYDGASSSNCKSWRGWDWKPCVTNGGGWCSSMADAWTRYARSIWGQTTFQCVGGEKTCEGVSKCPVLFYSKPRAISKGSEVTVTGVDECALSCHKTDGCKFFKYRAGGEGAFGCFVHDPVAGTLSDAVGDWESCEKID